MSSNSSTMYRAPPLPSGTRHTNIILADSSTSDNVFRQQHSEAVFIRLNGFSIIYWLACCVSAIVQILFTLFPLDFRILYLITHISLIASRSEVCWDKFDMNYRNQCLNGACLQDFDEHYKDQCNGGRWRQQYYFDKNRCIPFWYDGCTGESENLFQDEMSCLVTCENPTKKDPHKPWHGGDKFKMKEKLSEIHKPNLTDICAVANPCKNNSTCIFVWKKNTHYCKCQGGFTGVNCDEKIDFDPCAEGPCKNGATCTAKVENGKAKYECYCAPGYGGPQCDQRPCDVNPCLHNGTCRTTAGYSSYFCDCRDGYGGKNCDIVIGSAPPEEHYGANVLLVSSGKAEWIQQMKERLGAAGGALKTTTLAPVADAPYKSPAAKKLEREEREKQETERRDKEKMEQEEKKKQEELLIEQERLESEKRFNATPPNSFSTVLGLFVPLSLSLAIHLILWDSQLL
ncbi:EGF-like domain protein [Ostertagia ostertagi]